MIAAAKSYPAPSISRLMIAIGSFGYARRSLPLMFLSIRKPTPAASNFGAYARTRVVFKAARFGRLRLPANSAPLHGALRAAFESRRCSARAFVPHEAAQGAWLSNQDERHIT
jgi:hypothetical protein